MGKLAVRESPDSFPFDSREGVSLYRLMRIIRRCEEPLNRIYREGKIGGYLHLYIGQEAIAAGLIPLLRSDDYLLSAYRDHGHAIARGVDPKRIIAELYGRVTGCSRGKGGSMHIYDTGRNFLGGYGIVGGVVPLAVGVGFAIKYRGGDQICVCFFGDGAMNQGAVHEALNMASLFKVPCLFVLENNGYAMGTAVERHSAVTDFIQRVSYGYGIASERVDGMDLVEVREVAERAIAYIRKRSAPYFIEAECYRYAGHGFSDTAQQQKTYRSDEEIERWKQRDPIEIFGRRLREIGALSSSDEEEIDAEARRIADEAIDYAENSPEPPMDELYEHVFTEAG